MLGQNTRDYTYEWVKDAPEELGRIADSLDTKITAVFASSSILLGVITSLAEDIKPDLTLVPFAFAVVCFLVIFLLSGYQLLPKFFRLTDDPAILRAHYW